MMISAAAAAILAGTAGYALFGVKAVILCFVIYACAFAAKLILSREADILWLAMAALTATGALSYGVTANAHKTVDYIGRYVTLGGVLTSQAKPSATDDNYRYVFNVKSIDKNGEAVRDNETMLLVTPEKYRCGQSVIVKGIIKDLPQKMNEGGYNAASSYKSKNIFTRIYSADTRIGGGYTVNPISILGEKMREKLDDIIYARFTGDTAAVISAVLTGNMHRFSQDYNELLNRTGFKRILHPAYIYITLLSAMSAAVGSIINRRYRDTAVTVMLVALLALGGTHVGFVRCILMYIVRFLRLKRGGSGDYIDSIAEIAILFAVLSPMTLFDPALIISCASGICISKFAPIILDKLDFLPKPIGFPIALAVTCSVTITPFTAVYFNGVCLYSIVLTFLMMPIITLILICAPITLICMNIFGGAPIIGAYLRFTVWIVLKLPEIVAALPLSYIVIKTPSLPTLMAMAAAVFALYYVLVHERKKAHLCEICVGSLVLSAAICGLSHAGTAEFTFVNVGQGDGAVIHTAFGGTVIIDGGGGSAFSDYNNGEEIFVPYLESKGYDKIDAAFVSHFDKDHVEGVIAAVETLRVKHVFAPKPREGQDDDSAEFVGKLEAAARVRGTEIHYVESDARISFKHGLVIDMYAPDKTLALYGDENDNSLMLRAQYKGGSVLYTGDMSQTAEREWLRRGAEIKADVLKAAHHGSKYSTCAEWIAAVDPTYTIISCGENNSFGHPSKETLNRLLGRCVLRTDELGDIRILIGRGGIKRISALRGGSIN